MAVSSIVLIFWREISAPFLYYRRHETGTEGKTMDMEKKSRKRQNDNFAREELGALLRMFSALGLTVALGVLGSFLLGVWAEKTLIRLDIVSGGWVKVVFMILGLGMSVYWAYLRIARHLDKYGPLHDDRED
jgi:hypothetical protein